MKAHEAIAILESLDPNCEVTLTIGAAQPKTVPNIPKWNGIPMYPPQTREIWVKDPLTPPFTVTCKAIH
jgi:hypothetical protein